MREEWDFDNPEQNPEINIEPASEVPEDGSMRDNTSACENKPIQDSTSVYNEEAVRDNTSDCENVTDNASCCESESLRHDETDGKEEALRNDGTDCGNESPRHDETDCERKTVQDNAPVCADASGQGNTDENGTYHWVNPELAKRQQGAASETQNTYVASDFREHIGQGDWQNNGQNGQQTRNGYRGTDSQGGQQIGQFYWQNNNQNPQQTGNQGQWRNPQQNGNQEQWRNPQQNGNPGQWQNSQNTTNDNSQGTGYHDQSYQGGWGAYTNNRPKTGERQYGSYQFAQDDHVKSADGKAKKKKNKEKKPKGTGHKFLVTAALAAVFGVVAGGVMFGVNRLGNTVFKEPEQENVRVEIPAVETPEKSETAQGLVPQTSGEGQYSVAQVAANCMPSVVSITNASVTTVRDFFGGQQEYLSESSGSGIIVGQNDKELLIATNNHVVDGAKTITVAFSDEAVCEAQVKGTDANNDLAVIAVMLSDMSEETQNTIRIASIGDSDNLQVGEQVVAIGNALGYGQSVTSGWISALDREMLDTSGKSTGKLIQTDAAINPGNSGGALLNMNGELIGINSAKAMATEVEGMGYAIPISVAQPILDELMNRETRYIVDDESKASYIGVTCLSVDAASAQMYGIPAGAFVDSVEEGGPAANAGIIKGDVITRFDGLTIDGSTKLIETLQYYEAGETVEVVVSRAENGEYKEHTLSVTLGKRSEMKQQ